MTEPLLDPDSSREYLRDWKGRVDRAAAATQAMSERLDGLRISASDGNNLAEVVIDSGGVLVEVRFSERIRSVAPDAVSRAVMEAHGTARHRAAKARHDILSETLGADSAVARAIEERLA
ncbi:YbaB/EbfC family nucleoid-associated protein [Actinoplanes solisilvae]|uniref:YbaB/EbfC family nucleoid-associated protein n=1 Tax=Actinoplanes solisilvae TaxID=2486853 RepID=UPI000FD7E55F|nr:YbaB/EbfC family nucleoid-associated protein [Actinoplanes solisilvae]